MIFFTIFLSLVYFSLNDEIITNETNPVTIKYAFRNFTFELDNHTLINCTECMPLNIKFNTKGEMFMSFLENAKHIVNTTFAKYEEERNIFKAWPTGNNLLITQFDIDYEDNMYLLDKGKNLTTGLNYTKIVKYNKNGEKLYEIPITNLHSESILDNFVIVHNKNISFIADGIIYRNNYEYPEHSPAILVVSLDPNNTFSYRILENYSEPDEALWLKINNTRLYTQEPLLKGVVNLAVSCDNDTLYFSPLTSRLLYSIRIEELINIINSDSDSKTKQESMNKIPVYKGYKGEASESLVTSSKGNIYFGGIENGNIYIATEVETDLTRFDTKDFSVYESKGKFIYPTGLFITYGYLYFIDNKNYQVKFDKNYTKLNEDDDEYKYIIYQMEIGNDDNSYQRCSGFRNKWGPWTVVIWVIFGIIITCPMASIINLI